MKQQSYIPALAYRSLTGLYDPLVRITTRERRFKAVLHADAATSFTFLLTGIVESFYQRIDGNTWEAVLALTVVLADASTAVDGSAVVFQKKYSARKAITEKAPVGLARGMSEAMQQISGEIIEDIYTLLSK